MATLVFGVVGAVIGSTIPGVGTTWGWTIGTILGGMLFPPRLPGQGVGPLDDLRLGGSSYGSPKPICYGENTVGGQVIWQTDLDPHAHGGGMKGKAGPTQYTYSVSWACAFAKGPIDGVDEIWFGDQLVYENGETEFDIRIYLGTEDQLPDPDIEAIEGEGMVPAYRGTAYFAAIDVPVETWGNGIPPCRIKIAAQSDRYTEIQNSQANNVSVIKPDGSLWAGGVLFTSSLAQQFAAAQCSASLLHNGGQSEVAFDDCGAMWGIGQCQTGAEVSTPGTGGSLWGCGVTAGSSSSWVSNFGGNDLPNFGVGIRSVAGMTSSIRTAFYVVDFDKKLWHMGDGGFIGAGSLRGDGVWDPTTEPLEILTDVLDVAVTRFAVAARMSDKTVKLTGATAQMYGGGGTGNYNTWTDSGLENVEEIVGVPNNEGFLARLTDGTVWFSGTNNHNHAGNTALGTGNITTWTQVPLGGAFIEEISACARSASARDSDGNVYCWGEAEQAGQGVSGTTRVNPAIVITGCVRLGSSYDGMFALHEDQTPYGWGGNSGDELASGGTLGVQDEPVELPWSAPIELVDLASILEDVSDRVKLPAEFRDFSAGVGVRVRGYMLANRAETRGLIAPLMEIMNFDMIEVDGMVTIRERGGEVDWVIDPGHLGAHFWEERNNPPRPIEFLDPQETELPTQIDLAYFSANRNHEQATQTAIHYEKVQLSDKVTYNAPIVMTDDEARIAVETLLWTAHTDAKPAEIQLPWKYLGIAPADILSIAYNGKTLRFRVDTIKMAPLGYMKLELKADDPENLRHYVNGQGMRPNDRRRFGDVDPTNLVLAVWNGNAARDQDADLQDVYWAWTDKTGAVWPTQLQMSRDDGETWETIAIVGTYGQASSQQQVGDADSILADPDPATSGLVDIENTVEVTCWGGAPESCSIEDMIKQNLNLSILGDELIAFATVEALGGDRYRLSNLLRGLRGTDWAWGTHEIGERFAIARPGFAMSPTIEPFNRTGLSPYVLTIGSQFDFRLTHFSLMPDEGTEYPTEEDLVIEGNELKPYSVVDVEGERDGGNDLTITWVRRSRTGAYLRPFADIPIGEDEEAYEIDILDGAAVVRTITGLSSPTAVYTAAEQTADGLTPGDPVDLIIYQVGNNSLRGFARETTL